MRIAAQFLFVCLSVVLLHSAERESKEQSLHLPNSVLLLGCPQDDTLFVTSNGQELTLQPQGPTGRDIIRTRACLETARSWRPRM
jgi:hypothetical protein